MRFRRPKSKMMGNEEQPYFLSKQLGKRMRKIMNTLCLCVAVFFMTCQVNQKADKDVVTLDFTMAEKTLDWLDQMKISNEDTADKQYFMENVATTGGSQAIIHHWERFMEWDIEIFHTFIMEALDKIPSDRPTHNEDRTLTWFGRRKALWQEAFENTDKLRKEIAFLKKKNITKNALEKARTYLPDDAHISNDFFIVLFGGSSAFSVGKENGYDLLQLPRTPEGAIDVESVILTFAHEMHHTGFTTVMKKYAPHLEGDENTLLLGILAAEGMPTYFINKPLERLESMKSGHESMNRMLIDDWEKHAIHIQDYYQQAERDIILNLNGTIGQQEIFEKWMAGAQGPAYALGSDMFSVIDKHTGLDSAKAVVVNPLRFLSIYNNAAEKGNRKGYKYFIFSEEVIEKLGSYKRK